MSTLDLTLTEEMKGFVEAQAANRGFEDQGEYVRELIQHELDRQHLRALILEGANSPMAGVADEAYFESLRALARGTREE